jgi:CspA family cold shock protein
LPNDASGALHERFGFRKVGTFSANGRKFGQYWDVAWRRAVRFRVRAERASKAWTRWRAPGDDMATISGTVKTLTGKGFGFIAAADGQEYFFHQSACTGVRFDELREGQAVTFEKGQGPKGPRAENVQRA